MRTFFPYPIDDIDKFRLKLLQLSEQFSQYCFLDSNNYPDYPYSTFGSFYAIDALAVISANSDSLEQFEQFRQEHQDWIFGYLSYDLKNELESSLSSKNYDGLQQPNLHFFVPKYLVKIENDSVEIGVRNPGEIQAFQRLIDNTLLVDENKKHKTTELQHRISKDEYLESIEKIKNHIRRGDIYEMNFCQEFYAEDATINPISVFQKLNTISKAPFSCYLKNNKQYLLCASPERFLKRMHNRLISQPIKGTRKRMAEKQQDSLIKQQLFFDEKERSENVMIVDLVRNDFSKLAIQNTVEVEELFGIYTFEQVHQMISTVACSIPADLSFADIIKAVFPMGSMTGAPKLSAMKLIERYEQTKRGLFSGAVGYITPKGNFDFNVVIRSIQYNADNNYISIQTGSAITIDCSAKNEYDECLLKANAMFAALE